jgi:hypothetical protein
VISVPGSSERVSSRGRRTAELYPTSCLTHTAVAYLPPVGDSPDGTATWIVTLDGDPKRVATAAVWPGSAEPVPATSVPIPRPIRVAPAALEGREHLVANVAVVDDNDAFLAFGDDGAMLPTDLALPRGPVWLLVAGSGTSSRMTVSGHRTLCIGLGPGQREGGGSALAGAAGGSRIPP